MTSALVAVAVLAPFLLAGAFAWYLSGRGTWRALLTERFVYGVPWGTLVVLSIVLSVYLFVQGGVRHWSDPVVIPFRSWSYLYPTGVVISGFAHGSPGHLIGNLIGTVVLAPIAEYAWGHYPGGARTASSEGSGPNSRRAAFRPRWTLRARFRALFRRPWFRAVVVFPVAVLLVGLFASAFFLGPVIGFSGVVFAFGGFALVHYPVTTLVALLVSSVVRTTYRAITDPVVVQGISRGAPRLPWWAEIAIQGHALGILLGIVLGLALLLARGEQPNAGRIFLATLVYGITRNLWAIYWFVGDGTYVLFRAVGVVLVVVLTVLVTAAAAAGGRPVSWPLQHVPGSPTRRQLALGWIGLVVLGAVAAIGAAWVNDWPLVPAALIAGLGALFFTVPTMDVLVPGLEPMEAVTTRQAAFGILVVVTALIAGPAVFPNLVTTGDDAVPGTGSVEVKDYTVTYEEDVRNRMIPAIDLPIFREQTSVGTSGVIVVSEDRQIWTTGSSAQFLSSQGKATVTVGGIGWRDTVRAERSGWNVVGNRSVYVVDLSTDEDTVRSFESEPSRAEPRIQQHNVTLVPGADGFQIRVERDGERVGTARVQPAGNATSVGPIELRTERVDGRTAVFARADGTSVRVATRERYD